MSYDDRESCITTILLILLTLIPAAIISVLGNLFLPQFQFTLLGGFGIVVLIRWLKKLI